MRLGRRRDGVQSLQPEAGCDAGLPAAIKAVEGGATVIVVEVNYDVGGHAILSGGHMALGGSTSAPANPLTNATTTNAAVVDCPIRSESAPTAGPSARSVIQRTP